MADDEDSKHVEWITGDYRVSVVVDSMVEIYFRRTGDEYILDLDVALKLRDWLNKTFPDRA